MSRGPVTNQFPTRASAYKLAFVGEAPGAEEVRLGYPFAGAAGFLLNGVLSSIGLSREECFVGNVCQFKPSATSNEFHLLDWNGEEVQAGIVQLSADLASFQPCIVVALGNVPLHLFRHGNIAPTRTATGYKWLSKITNWRGSLFTSATDPSYKCLPTWHPAYVLRVYSRLFDLRQDLRKARDEGTDPVLELPRFDIQWGPAAENPNQP